MTGLDRSEAMTSYRVGNDPRLYVGISTREKLGIILDKVATRRLESNGKIK